MAPAKPGAAARLSPRSPAPAERHERVNPSASTTHMNPLWPPARTQNRPCPTNRSTHSAPASSTLSRRSCGGSIQRTTCPAGTFHPARRAHRPHRADRQLGRRDHRSPVTVWSNACATASRRPARTPALLTVEIYRVPRQCLSPARVPRQCFEHCQSTQYCKRSMTSDSAGDRRLHCQPLIPRAPAGVRGMSSSSTPPSQLHRR